MNSENVKSLNTFESISLWLHHYHMLILLYVDSICHLNNLLWEPHDSHKALTKYWSYFIRNNLIATQDIWVNLLGWEKKKKKRKDKMYMHSWTIRNVIMSIPLFSLLQICQSEMSGLPHKMEQNSIGLCLQDTDCDIIQYHILKPMKEKKNIWKPEDFFLRFLWQHLEIKR